MSMNIGISRRTVLKGLGTAIALPWLEAMTPALSLAAPTKQPPRRMAFFYVPNGVNVAEWTPAAVGEKFALPNALEPLKAFQKDLLVLSGLTADKARANGDGPGDHARAMSAFLTGRQPRKTSGADIRAGISVDQLAADRIGKSTRFPSLELGIERGMNSGNCDSGYSCAYSANLSWHSESTPMAKEVNPRLVFERLFGGDVKEESQSVRLKRERYRLSVLDFVLEDAASLRNRLGSTDQRKLDEYLGAVRDLEVRIVRNTASPLERNSTYPRPAGIPEEYADHIKLMNDLLALSFQADLTRVATFVYANDGSNRSYKFIGVPEGHHDLSHHGGNKEKLDKIRQINRFHISQFAYFIGKLKSIHEGDGTLLDHCMLLYGSGIGDGNRHNHDDLPILLAGQGGGTLRTGRHVKYPHDTPLTNLYLSMLERVGVETKSFGDSTGKLENLNAR
jgi:hypothetical protein